MSCPDSSMRCPADRFALQSFPDDLVCSCSCRTSGVKRRFALVLVSVSRVIVMRRGYMGHTERDWT